MQLENVISGIYGEKSDQKTIFQPNSVAEIWFIIRITMELKRIPRSADTQQD